MSDLDNFYMGVFGVISIAIAHSPWLAVRRRGLLPDRDPEDARARGSWAGQAAARREAAMPRRYASRQSPQTPRPRAPDDRPEHAPTEAMPTVAIVGPKRSDSDAGGEAGDGHRQRDEAVVGGEDAAADPVGRFALQAVRRCLPLRAAAEVRDEDGERNRR